MESNPYAAPRAEVRDIVETSGTLVLAHRGRRLIASILDGLVGALMIGGPIGAVMGFSAAAGSFPSDYSELGDLPAAAMAAGLVGTAALVAITWHLVHTNGQTIAKKMLGIKVVRSDGSRASVARIFWIRNVPFALAGNIPWLAIGTISFLVDSLLIFRSSSQCLHDQLADTVVIEA